MIVGFMAEGIGVAPEPFGGFEFGSVGFAVQRGLRWWGCPGRSPGPAGGARTGGTYGNDGVNAIVLATDNGPSLAGGGGMLAGVRGALAER